MREPVLLSALARDASLVRRPIVVVDGVALVGFDGGLDADTEAPA